MEMTKKQWRVIGVIVAVVALASVYYLKINEPELSPSSAGTLDFTPATTKNASTTSDTVPTQDKAVKMVAPTTEPFPINTADKITSWSFKGVYDGNETLIAKANVDITLLTGLLGKGKYDDYDLYNGIANDYGFLGDGTQAYLYYNRSIQIHPDKGLAYANLAHLFDLLGAKYSAADAYAKATTVEAGMLEYHIERLTYLTRVFPTDTARITAALTAVSKQFGDTAEILAIEADWLTGQKRYADATLAWEKVKMLSPGKDTSAIDAAIARLKAKQ